MENEKKKNKRENITYYCEVVLFNNRLLLYTIASKINLKRKKIDTQKTTNERFLYKKNN